jgi:hypothetical protein
MSRDHDILRRLVSPDAPPRIFATVVSRRPDGRYVVQDDLGHSLTVDGAAGYLPGADVIIQAGRIVDTGSRPPITTTIRV